MPKLSIIVPIYNAEAYLDRCLTSIKLQSFKDFEVIMVDDGSTDHSSDICRKYIREDTRFNYFFQENHGQSAARNYGLQNAKGTWIGFCDSDDWIDPDYYEKILHSFDISECGCVIGGFQKDNTEKSIQVVSPEKSEIITIDVLTERFIEYTENSMLNSVCNKVFLKEKIEVLFPDEMTCGEDFYFCMYYLSKIKKIGVVKTEGYHYFCPITGTVKYKDNDARQCEKYTMSAKPLLNRSSSMMGNAEKKYNTFACGNIGRDVAMIAKSSDYRRAKEKIIEFYQRPTLKVAIYSDGWDTLNIKYRFVGMLLRCRMVVFLIVVARIFA